MADTVSYETVQQAATSIVELASNVLVAVNTPLLDRGTVIGLDYDRANTLPPDYDGDIESVWSNPNMFADGDDFSWETIQKNRNMYYQQQSSSGIVDQIEDILSKAVNVLSYHLNVGQKNTISTDSISMITEKLALDNLNSLTINASAGAKITLPPLDYCILFSNETCSNSTPITVNVSSFLFSILFFFYIIFIDYFSLLYYHWQLQVKMDVRKRLSTCHEVFH